jgi:hypothetical protein
MRNIYYNIQLLKITYLFRTTVHNSCMTQKKIFLNKFPIGCRNGKHVPSEIAEANVRACECVITPFVPLHDNLPLYSKMKFQGDTFPPTDKRTKRQVPVIWYYVGGWWLALFTLCRPSVFTARHKLNLFTLFKLILVFKQRTDQASRDRALKG